MSPLIDSALLVTTSLVACLSTLSVSTEEIDRSFFTSSLPVSPEAVTSFSTSLFSSADITSV